MRTSSPPSTPAGSQRSRPRGGAPNVARVHGTKTASAITSYALRGSPKAASPATATASAIGAATSLRQSRNAASTAADVVSTSAGPSSRQAGIPVSAEARPISHGYSGGYSAATCATIPSALAQVTL